MPKYPGQGAAKLLNTNAQAFLITADDRLIGGFTSIAFLLERQKSAFYPLGVSYEFKFTADPGTFEIDIQHSDTDVDGNFVTVNAISNLNSNFCARVELPACYTRYVRVVVVSITNDVRLTAQVTR